ncbi:peptidylprolyl isomerase [Ruegeria sp. 2012CJ41-6]|uniref:Peptidylprolyl isomerase n=1 Tax=Ruegeria spongiae TaxID=2942209 RepID=A0ABT0Q7D4_9RHOB|nr:peptidylprolyl isomerase [Ruegeria spongiae]MCL6285791.1 peptidylprolyl isomerase [Ruegeria spongiae]
MRIVKEPLLHFLLVGIAIFVWFARVEPENSTVAPDEVIIVDEGDVGLLRTRFQTSWNRPPNQTELQALIDALVREEVLVREARKLGLNRGDQVIRARLAQKMDFLTDAIASSVVPEDDVLAAYLQDNPQQFMSAPQFAFEQVFLGDAPNSDDVQNALSALNSGIDRSMVGTPSLLPATMSLSAGRTVDAAFGRGFSGAIAPLQPGIWSGPIPSGYGQHLVRITETQPSQLPPLDAIRESVAQQWRRKVGVELAQVQYEKLAGQYQITMPDLGAMAQ